MPKRQPTQVATTMKAALAASFTCCSQDSFRVASTLELVSSSSSVASSAQSAPQYFLKDPAIGREINRLEGIPGPASQDASKNAPTRGWLPLNGNGRRWTWRMKFRFPSDFLRFPRRGGRLRTSLDACAFGHMGYRSVRTALLDGGPCRDRTYDQLIKRRSFYQVLLDLESISYRSRTVPHFAELPGVKTLIS